MKVVDASQLFLAVEEGINRYILSCRDRVDGFVSQHYYIWESLRIHRRLFLHDFLCYPINTLWTLPYLIIKQCVETLEKVGLSGPQQVFARIPAGIKTRYQREIESRIESELLGWPGTLFYQLRSDARLTSLMDSGILSEEGVFPVAPVRALLEEHAMGSKAIADLSGTAGTMLVGWLMFHDQNLTVGEIGSRLAHERAQEQSASHFFLGKELGRAWYTVVPPVPTKIDVVIGTFLAFFLFAGICLAASIMTDPLRKALGLQKKALQKFIDRLEEHLHMQVSKAVRRILTAPTFSDVPKSDQVPIR